MTLEQAQDLLNRASLESETSYNWPTGPAGKILNKTFDETYRELLYDMVQKLTEGTKK